MESNTNSAFDDFRQEWINVWVYLKDFFKNPLLCLKRLPDWRWRTLIVFQLTVSIVCALLAGILAQSISKALLGTVFLPITTLTTYFVVSGFFYYFSLFVLGREIDYQKIVTLMILANLPMMAINLLSVYLSPILLIGMAVSAILLTVGFVDYFILPKKTVVRAMAALYLVFVGMWIVNSIELDKSERVRAIQATPESLDILEKELKGK